MEFYLNNDKIKDKSITKEKLSDNAIPTASTTQAGIVQVGKGLNVTDDGTLSLSDIFVLGYYDKKGDTFRNVKGTTYTRDFTVSGEAKSTGSWADSKEVNTGEMVYEGLIEGDTSKIYIDQTYDTLDLYRYTGSGYVQLNTYPPVIKAGATDTWGKGVPAVGSDGVMEVGKYIDFHSAKDSNTDYNIRLISEATGKIQIKLPLSDGTLALQADVEDLNDSLDDAVTKLNEASDQMNYVDAELNGDVLTVTNKNNEKKSVNLVDNYEKVTVQLTSSVSGVSLNNVSLNVYINHDTTTPITYTTDSNGKAEFQVAKGNYYQVTFPDKANCEHIAPIGYTATVSSRTITAEYKKISEEHLETVNVYVRYYNQSTTATPFSDVEVSYTVDGVTIKLTTNSNGFSSFKVAWGKEYTVSVPDNYNNYYLWYRSPSTTQTSENSSRALYFNYYPFEAGVFIVSDEGLEYTADEWVDSGLTEDKAVLIKVLTNDLVVNSRTVYIDAQMTQTGYKSAQWQAGNSNYLLTLPDGANTNDGKVCTDGYIASAAAAESGGISTPAMSLAVTYTATIESTNFRGYLGSGQQWNQFWSNVDLVDECITNIFGDDAKTFQNNYTNAKWTSTQSSSNVAYYWGTSLGTYVKYGGSLVVPFLAMLPTD